MLPQHADLVLKHLPVENTPWEGCTYEPFRILVPEGFNLTGAVARSLQVASLLHHEYLIKAQNAGAKAMEVACQGGRAENCAEYSEKAKAHHRKALQYESLFNAIVAICHEWVLKNQGHQWYVA